MTLRPSYIRGFAPRDFQPLYPTLWRGLIGSWAPCLGPSGNTVYDYSGLGYNGTLTGMNAETDWVVSENQYALDFDGTDDNVRALGKSFTTRGSVSLWLNARSLSLGMMAIIATASLGGQLSSYNFGIGVTTTGLTQAYIYDGSQKRASGETIVTNKWVHCALTFVNGTSFKIYTSGIFRNSTALGTAHANLPAWQIGSGTGALNAPTIQNYWNGQLDDIRLYDRELSDAEIAILALERGIAYRPRTKRKTAQAPVTTSSRNRSSRFLGFPS